MYGAKTKGWIKNNTTGVKMSFQFNPTTFEYGRGATYVELTAPGLPYPVTAYISGTSTSFSIELVIFDKPYKGLHESTEKFLKAFLPPEVNTAKYKKPPEMTFCYGSFIKTCVLENMTVRIDLMNSNLKPTYSTFSLQLKQV